MRKAINRYVLPLCLMLLLALSLAGHGMAVQIIKFKDVPSGSWFEESVDWAVKKNITNGTSTLEFSPSETCNNAQVITFLWRASGSPDTEIENPFTDISSGSYYYKAALWAYEKGMISGRQFGPEKPCTRSAVVTYLWQMAGSAPVGAGTQFEDVDSDSAFASAVAWAVDMGITTGTGSVTFSPDVTCTRAQVMTFLYRGKDVLVTDGDNSTSADGNEGKLIPVEPAPSEDGSDMKLVWQ